MKSNQIKTNPFPYSNTNKRYYTLTYYYQNLYGQKVAKIPLNAHFTCPNRDGTKGVGGCSFCSALGSGDSILESQASLFEQYESNLARMQKKWSHCLGVAYFQSYSNTYAPLEKLKELYEPFFAREDVLEIHIATRADCLDEKIVAYFNEKAKIKPVWIELGLQSIYDSTMEHLNRQHSSSLVFEWIEKLKKTRIKSCIHLIDSLPHENQAMMIESAKKVGLAHPDAIKIHMLHVVKNAPLALSYAQSPFSLFDEATYVETVVRQLEVLPEDIIVERLTGDALKEELIAPEWTLKKTIVLNDIDKRMVEWNTWQGKAFKQKQGSNS